MATRLSAILCEQHDRVAFYQTSAPVHEVVPDLLGGYDPRPQNWPNLQPHVREMYQKLQRKTGKGPREDLKSYVFNRMSPRATWVGGFPGIVIGMPLTQEFRPMGAEDHEDIGSLKVRKDLQRPNILLDGLRRFTSLLDTAQDETLPDDVRQWAANYRLPIMLVTGAHDNILTEEEMGQFFHDFNVTAVPISKGQAIDLDRSDVYVLTTNDVGALNVVAEHGGMDARATTIRGGAWTTKTILLKSVRAAAEGPGSHVDHIREKLENPWLKSADEQRLLVDRFDESLITFVGGLPESTVPADATLLRTGTWWIAFGLLLNDLYKSYSGSTISDEKREVLLRRVADIDWGLGNPELSFLGKSVAEKDRKTQTFLPVPTDDTGRQMINRFYGGAKSYFNLAAYMRRKIKLFETVDYGNDYGTSVQFDDNGALVSSAESEAVSPETVARVLAEADA
jgi:hypothetical protein